MHVTDQRAPAQNAVYAIGPHFRPKTAVLYRKQPGPNYEEDFYAAKGVY